MKAGVYASESEAIADLQQMYLRVRWGGFAYGFALGWLGGMVFVAWLT